MEEMFKMKWNYRSLAAGDFDDKSATLTSHAPPNGTVESNLIETPTKASTSPDLFLRPRGAERISFSLRASVENSAKEQRATLDFP